MSFEPSINNFPVLLGSLGWQKRASRATVPVIEGWRSMKKSFCWAVTAILTAMLGTSLLVCAQQGTTSLHGTISDPDGSAISGAAVKLEDAARGFKAATTSNATGQFEFLQLTPTTYELTV